MPATDRSKDLLDSNQETIEEFINFVWKKEKDLDRARDESASLYNTFILLENDEEMSGIRANHDYGRWIESLDPVERANLDLRGSFILMIAAQAMEMKHGPHYYEKGRKENATQLPLGSILKAARNQALHFHENQEPKKKDKSTWDCLKDSYGPFLEFPSQCSYAGFILKNVLKWKDFDTLCADIKSSP